MPIDNMEFKVVVGVIVNESSQILVAKRPQFKHLAGLWEFPGGKIERNESPEAALRRELLEEVGIEVQQATRWMQLTHQYSEKTVHLDIWRILSFSGIPAGMEGQLIRWVTKTELTDLEFPEANSAIVEAVVKYLD